MDYVYILTYGTYVKLKLCGFSSTFASRVCNSILCPYEMSFKSWSANRSASSNSLLNFSQRSERQAICLLPTPGVRMYVYVVKQFVCMYVCMYVCIYVYVC